MIRETLSRITVKPQAKKVSWGWLNNSWRLLSLPLLLFIALPLAALLLRISPSTFLTDIKQHQVAQAVGLSLGTSLITTLVTLALGTPVAYLLSQRRSRFFQLIDTIIDLPTVLPPAVAGVALLMAFGRRGLFGGWLAAAGLSIPFTPVAVIMAQTFIAAPLYVKAATIGFAGVHGELKQAAALDGASRIEIFRYVTLPLSGMSILTGLVMTWARAMGEFGATMIFAGNFPGRTQTMPLAIYVGFEIDLDVALALSLVLVCFSFLTLILVKGFLNRRMGLT